MFDILYVLPVNYLSCKYLNNNKLATRQIRYHITKLLQFWPAYLAMYLQENYQYFFLIMVQHQMLAKLGLFSHLVSFVLKKIYEIDNTLVNA